MKVVSLGPVPSSALLEGFGLLFSKAILNLLLSKAVRASSGFLGSWFRWFWSKLSGFGFSGSDLAMPGSKGLFSNDVP